MYQQQQLYLANIVYFLTISWKIPGYLNNGNSDCCITKSNYRPITILPSLSKIFETLIHSRISHYFDDIFHEHVFAYRKNHGTDTAVLSLTEQWRKELDQHNIIGMGLNYVERLKIALTFGFPNKLTDKRCREIMPLQWLFTEDISHNQTIPLY
ncbi:hypothetical protein P5673_009645, partial [Acropora cervicornis]